LVQCYATLFAGYIFITFLTDRQPLSEPAARGLPARPASLLTHIYTLLGHHLATPPPLEALALAFLLQHASAPWLAQLHAWIGVVDTTETEDSKQQPWTDLGITRVRTPSGWEYEFSRRRMPMPAFVAPATAQTFFDAGRALRALRDASGGRHPLCWTEWPMKAAWGWGPEEGDGCVAAFISRG
jgi:hypothetical protein